MFLQPRHTSTIDVQCSFICMTQLRERFQGDSAIVNRPLLLPKLCNLHHLLKLKNFHNRTVLFFSSVSVTVYALETEQLRWKSYWQRQDLGTYPALVILLRLFATTLITTTTAERSSRNLKFFKNT